MTILVLGRNGDALRVSLAEFILLQMIEIVIIFRTHNHLALAILALEKIDEIKSLPKPSSIGRAHWLFSF